MSVQDSENRVVVVGGGGAACRAAIAAYDAGATVLVVMKGRLGASGATAYRVAEMAAFNVADGVVDPDDGPDVFFNDIMTAGQGMADPWLARVLVEEAPRALCDLQEWGVPFETKNGRFAEIQACFSSRPRSHIIRGHGEPILRALITQMRRRSIDVLEGLAVTRILTRDGACVGVQAISEGGDQVEIPAGAVVLATGGAGQLFRRNLNPPDVCGDGYTLGFEAGAELVNMEFMQAGLGIGDPTDNILNAWIWSTFPALTNAEGKPFLHAYLDPSTSAETAMEAHSRHFPFSSTGPSRYLELSVLGEIRANRSTPRGCVGLDLSHLTDKYLSSGIVDPALATMWPITRSYWEAKGIRPLDGPVDITCFAHAVNGGLRIDPECRTTVPGLFAAGETAGGPHGADRLGGNMMVTCQVFGERAGRFAAGFAAAAADNAGRSGPIPPPVPDTEPMALLSEATIPELRRRVADLCQGRLLISRDEAGLRALRDELRGVDAAALSTLRSRFRRPAWELHCLCVTGLLMTEAAARRDESRGSHYRSDHPTRRGDAGRPTILQRGPDGGILLSVPGTG